MTWKMLCLKWAKWCIEDADLCERIGNASAAAEFRALSLRWSIAARG